MSQIRTQNFLIRSENEIGVEFLKSLEALLKESHVHLTHQARTDLKTAFYEACANAIRHAKELETHDAVLGQFYLNAKAIGFEVWDHGSGFDMDAVPVPDFNSYQSSGRGVFMMKQLGDEVKYSKSKSKNTLKFMRYLVGQDATTREIEFLYEVSEAVVQGQSLETLYQIILDKALEIFHVDRASILIFDEATRTLKVKASRGLAEDVVQNIDVKSGEGVSGYVFQHGRPLLIEDIDTNRRGIEKKKHYKSKSFMSVPMIYSPTRENEKIIGVINLTDRQDGEQFTKKDLKLLSTIANQAMSSLYIRDLLDEVRQSASMKNQLSIVRNIQESYLPKASLNIRGFEVDGLCEMADSLGGDYYDYFEAGPWLYLVVADISGHNIASAMSMFNFRSQLRSLLPLEMDPATLLTHLNKNLYADLAQSAHFVTALIFKIHTKTLEWQLASAGHYPPLFFPERFQFIANGMVLGIQPEEIYTNTTGVFEPHDHVLLFTDGMIEAMNQTQGFFGLERLKQSFKNNHDKSSPDLIRKLIEEVKKFRNVDYSLDDLTVLSLKCHGNL